MIEKPSLGLPVRFTWTLSRRTQTREGKAEQFRKVWVTSAWPGQQEPNPRLGILVGIRVLSNGGVDYGWEDSPTVYTSEERLTAYLVAYQLRRKPVLCLPEHVFDVQPHERWAGDDQPVPGWQQAVGAES